MCQNAKIGKVAIGDPVSSASKKAARLKARGVEVVEFRTFNRYSEYYTRSYNPELFAATYEFDGDNEKAIAYLKANGIEHLIIGADSSIKAVERINHRLGRLKNDPAKIDARYDKLAQALAYSADGLPVVGQEFFSVDQEDEALAYAEGRYPQVLKPRASGGTNNVLLAWDRGEFRDAFRKIGASKSLYDRPNGGALIMDYIPPGATRERVVDAVSCPINGTDAHHVITDCWEYEKVPMNGVPALYRAMRALSFDEAADEIHFARRMLKAVGHRQGESHLEIWRLDDPDLVRAYGSRNLPVEGAYGRLPGLITELSAAATGRDQTELALDSVLDPFVFFAQAQHMPASGPLRKAAAIVFLASNRDGLLKSNPPLAAVKALASYHSSFFKAMRVGDRLQKSVDVATLAGWVGLCHEDPAVVERDMAMVQAMEPELVDTE
jgi:hypothetical protein